MVLMTFNEHWPYNPVEPGYPTYTTLRTLVKQFSLQVSTTPIPGRAVSLYPLLKDLSYYEPQTRFNREGRVRRFVALCSRQILFVAFVVVGPWDLSICLTSALHYNWLVRELELQ